MAHRATLATLHDAIKTFRDVGEPGGHEPAGERSGSGHAAPLTEPG